MTVRNIFSRVEKLEARQRTADEMLLIWRKPDVDTDATVLVANKAGLFGSGDLVLCAEWFSAKTLPAPRWIRRIKSDLDESELAALYRTAERLAGPDVANDDAARSYSHVPDEKLWYTILGVRT
jgi:hypothetical protein